MKYLTNKMQYGKVYSYQIIDENNKKEVYKENYILTQTNVRYTIIVNEKLEPKRESPITVLAHHNVIGTSSKQT